jgi:hypothetical protein
MSSAQPSAASAMSSAQPAPCRPCREAPKPVSAITVAIIIVLAVFVIFVVTRGISAPRLLHKDSFVSNRAREVYNISRDLFDRSSGSAPYSEYKTAIADADAVLYTDARQLWKAGRLTPEAIQSKLA